MNKNYKNSHLICKPLTINQSYERKFLERLVAQRITELQRLLTNGNGF